MYYEIKKYIHESGRLIEVHVPNEGGTTHYFACTAMNASNGKDSVQVPIKAEILKATTIDEAFTLFDKAVDDFIALKNVEARSRILIPRRK
jgi:hypothetical protein